ncbi:MAG TPA: two-component regulator propeller domain-containing protein, partial [Terriglobia bacterium]|nr:two-component regulator propeller domain-containing protein [Terriglobia bacterium]
MVHTSWTVRDGAPQNINALAQTADGTLWLGTRDGLYSFDGLKFSVSNLVPRKDVQSLFATREGDLWVMGLAGPAIRIRSGEAKVFDHVDTDAIQRMMDVEEDHGGAIWALLNSKKLVRLGTDEVWHVATGPKPDCNVLEAFFIDSLGTQWVVADTFLYRRARGEENFRPTHLTVYGVMNIAEGRDDSIWIAASHRAPANPLEVGLRHIDQFGKALANPATREDVTDVVLGTDGFAWLSHSGGGLERLAPYEANGTPHRFQSNSPDIFGVADGLITTGYRVLLRDAEGSIWVAGGRGIENFRRATMVPIVANAINGWWSFCVAPNDDVWVAVLDGFRGLVRGNRVTRLKDRDNITAILCGQDGRVRMFIMDGGIAEVRSGQLHFLPLLPGHGVYWVPYRFTSVVVLQDDQILASTRGTTENGLWIYQKGRWKPFLPEAGIERITAMMKDARNKLWLGSVDGKIIALDAKTHQIISSASPGIGPVVGFSETGYGVFALGQNGIALKHPGSFQALRMDDPDLATSVTGLAEDRNHDIWINGSRAIARIPSVEIKAVVSDPNHRILAHEFREGDFRGSDIFTYSRNSAQLDSRGRVWLATANGIIYIDPQHLDRPSHLPTLSIRSITADGKPLNLNATIAPGTQALNVRYLGLNLSNPTGVIYRYRLMGYDPEWQDVGSRAEAIYTHLRPGTYRFQVIASNGDGIWTQALSASPFTVLPAFYQTWWFESLCALMVVLALWLGITARVRYVSSAIRIRAEGRADERIRIARELHDTLLQGVQGLLLSFHAAAEKVSADHESKAALEKALSAADRIILEGRNRVTRLRSENLSDAELKPSIEGVAADLSDTAIVNFGVERKGGSDTLHDHVVDEVFYIAREALTNAFRHAEASRIEVELDYQKREFKMTCRDNGRGFDTDAVRANHTNGHWGLRGMAERAGRIGAHFCYASSVDKGTEVQVTIPARRAYVRHG